MRIGLWNRLAIVATVLACIIAPIWIWLDIAFEIEASRQLWYETCTALADDQPVLADSMAAHARCRDQRSEPSSLGWDDWREFVGGTFVACIIIYLLIWAIAATVKWVWRGRNVDAGIDKVHK